MSTTKREMRSFASASKLELRKANGKNRISGLAIAFNKASQDMGFIEYISPTALDKTLSDTSNQVALLREHSTELLLGRRGVNLDLKITKDGLRFECDLLDNATANTAYVDIQAGLLDACSFGFYVPQGGDEWSMVNGQATRRVNELQLAEISLVYFPAYADVTSVDARQLRAIAAKLKRDSGDAQDLDYTDEGDTDIDDTSDALFTPCDDCDDLCARCSSLRSKRTAAGLDFLPLRMGLCLRCVRSALCERCFDRYMSAISEDDPDDARSIRRKMASLLLRMAAQ